MIPDEDLWTTSTPADSRFPARHDKPYQSLIKGVVCYTFGIFFEDPSTTNHLVGLLLEVYP
jgi:hypothetical protein